MERWVVRDLATWRDSGASLRVCACTVRMGCMIRRECPPATKEKWKKEKGDEVCWSRAASTSPHSILSRCHIVTPAAVRSVRRSVAQRLARCQKRFARIFTFICRIFQYDPQRVMCSKTGKCNKCARGPENVLVDRKTKSNLFGVVAPRTDVSAMAFSRNNP